MYQRPLQYQSLKTVLLHMEANVRFQISQQMPSIRKVEKLVPLKINRLDFDYYKVTINDTEYKLRIHRQYSSEIAPNRVEEESYEVFDFDEFGFGLHEDNHVLLPGDVPLSNKTPVQIWPNEEEHERMWRRILGNYKKALELRAELESKGQTYKDYLDNFPRNPDDPNEEEVRRIVCYDDESLKNTIETCLDELMPYDYRRSNTKPPYKHEFRLKITKGESVKVQRSEYTKKSYEALKHLNQVFFGGRAMPIFVENFKIADYSLVLRVPVGFNLGVKTLEVLTDGDNLENLYRIVENSENLDTLFLSYDDFFDLPPANGLAQKARKLVISYSHLDLQDAKDFIRQFQNPFLCFNVTGRGYTALDYFVLILHWLNENRPIGSKLYIGTENWETAEEVLKLVSNSYENSQGTERCITVNISESKKLGIFYEPFEEKHVSHLVYNQFADIRSKWIMKMRVMEI